MSYYSSFKILMSNYTFNILSVFGLAERGWIIGFLLLQPFIIGRVVKYLSCFTLVLKLDLYAGCFDDRIACMFINHSRCYSEGYVHAKPVLARSNLDRVKRIWYLSPMRAAKVQASPQSRQNLRCSLIQAVSQEEPSDRKPDPWPLWMAGHAQLKFVMTEWSKTQIRLRGSFITDGYNTLLLLQIILVRFLFVFDRLLILFKIVLWPSAWKVLSAWFFVCALLLYAILIVYVPFPIGF